MPSSIRDIERVFIGAAGGLAAVAVKFLGQDFDFLVDNISGITLEKQSSLIFGYAVITPILMFLGALCAWASEEPKRLRLLALSVSAPALITTWSGGNKDVNNRPTDLSRLGYAYVEVAQATLISNAIAQSTTSGRRAANPSIEGVGAAGGYPPIDSSELESPKTTAQKIKEGVKLFFGYGRVPAKYWVVVGSFKDLRRAHRLVEKINKEDDGLNAFVGFRQLPNPYYPVIVGRPSTLSDAKALLDRAKATTVVDDGFLSKANWL